MAVPLELSAVLPRTATGGSTAATAKTKAVWRRNSRRDWQGARKDAGSAFAIIESIEIPNGSSVQKKTSSAVSRDRRDSPFCLLHPCNSDPKSPFAGSETPKIVLRMTAKAHTDEMQLPIDDAMKRPR